MRAQEETRGPNRLWFACRPRLLAVCGRRWYERGPRQRRGERVAPYPACAPVSSGSTLTLRVGGVPVGGGLLASIAAIMRCPLDHRCPLHGREAGGAAPSARRRGHADLAGAGARGNGGRDSGRGLDGEHGRGAV